MDSIRPEIASVDVYIFGSLLSTRQFVSDVDLLVVYSEGDDLALVKAAFNRIGERLPLDLIYMTNQEEEELDFIRGQQAINVCEWLRREPDKL